MSKEATCKDFLQVQKEGERQVQRTRKFYKLDAIISVGYRVGCILYTFTGIHIMRMHE